MAGMKHARMLVVAGVLAALGVLLVPRSMAAPEDAKPALADLAWLAGHWGGERDGRVTEEAWLAPAGGFLIGVNRTVSRDGKGQFEYLRIEERPGGIVYVASPGGEGRTDFPLVEVHDGYALFENPGHDFPKSLVYRRDAEGALHVRAAREVGGEGGGLEWTWTRR
jgi:hypothetical protein